MINLWYEESYWGSGRSGPQRVVTNTVEALKQEHIPYSVNEDKYQYNFLMQYQHDVALRKHEKLEHDTCLIGPQFWPFDSYGEFLIRNQEYFKKIIAPSDWVYNLFTTKCGLSPDKVAVWSAGIQVLDIKSNPTVDCLIYHKGRSDNDLQSAIEFLKKKKLSYMILKYGSYSPEEFYDCLSQVTFCFVIDSTESQGIAIQEMMACNKPLFVWDVEEWNYMGESYVVPASSVPYWNDSCGKRFFNFLELEDSFDEFYSNINYYESKKIIETELSYSHSVKKLINIFEE